MDSKNPPHEDEVQKQGLSERSHLDNAVQESNDLVVTPSPEKEEVYDTITLYILGFKFLNNNHNFTSSINTGGLCLWYYIIFANMFP